jgi:hypothetical protein
MSMDLIAGTVILTAVLMLVFGLAAVFLTRLPGVADTGHALQRGRLLLTILIGIYVLGMTDVLIITQQYNLAFVNLVAGSALALIQYFAGQRQARAAVPEGEDAAGTPRR